MGAIDIGLSGLELRSSGELRRFDQKTITGYAAVFNKETVIGHPTKGWREVVRPGAFAGVLDQDVRALFNHDANVLLGRASAGTLKFSEDGHGLKVEIDPPDTQTVRDLVLGPMMRRELNGMSIRFMVAEDGDRWEPRSGPKLALREIVRIARLDEVSVVTFPAFEATEATLRSFNALARPRLELVRARFGF